MFYFIAAVLVFIFLFSLLSFFEYKYDLDFPFVEILDNHNKVHVPFLGLDINIPRNYAVVLMFTAMMYYFMYFYTFKEFLRVFMIKRTFGTKSLKRLRFFLILNIIPLLYIIIFTASFAIKGIPIRFEDDYFIVLAHLAIAFLIYLYLDVLQKGNNIQEENDLTI